jgi:serine phosphatase RsbU (regulator of sigma subunit)
MLLISDSRQTRSALAWMMSVAFHEPILVEAETAADASETLSSQRVDCVILDAGCAAVSDVLRRLKARTVNEHVPLLLLASGHDARQRDLGESHGITHWLFRESLAPNLLEQSVRSAIEVASLQLMLDEQGRELERLHELEQAAAAKSSEDSASPDQTAAATQNLPITDFDAPPGALDQPLSEQSVEDEELASRVQKDLQPPGSPLIDGYEVAGLSVSAAATGGDYYDYLPMADELLTISIGECSGSGLAPVILMSSLRAYLRVLSRRSLDVSEVISEANTLITDDIGDEEFLVTLMLVQIDSMTKSLCYCSAGLQAHIVSKSGEATVLPSTGMPLGLRGMRVIPPGDRQKLRAGDILLLATDGAQKTASPTGEPFGLDRMLDIVRQNRDLPPRMIVNFLKKACLEFAGDAGPSDDITIVLVKASDHGVV